MASKVKQAAQTPGKWHITPGIIEAKVNLDGFERFISIEAEGYSAGGGVALVHIKGNEAIAEQRAALIASAPELLAERDRLKEVNAILLEALESAGQLLLVLETSNDADTTETRKVIDKAIKAASEGRAE